MEKVITIPDNPDEYLLLTKGETKEEIPITFTKKNNNEYGMKLNPKKDIDNNLNNALGVIKENEQNKSLFFILKKMLILLWIMIIILLSKNLYSKEKF
jgi:diacylglycerol kinase family enzyme